ncbi:MAG TPA: SsrA-binding protein [Bacteroidetes bacterium]|nr:SsrA-binding protein [Bacteroidota bacterium]HCN37853.1 SsrA-binding protein [Bacteroidota bacterium]
MSDNDKVKIIVTNRKANFQYEIIDKFEAGLVLSGTEVKSLRDNKANLQESFAKIRNGEIWLLNCHISEYKFGNLNNHEPTRPRKLLFHNYQIKKIKTSLEQKGLTLVPLKLYFKNSKVKAEVALARGKKIYDKRETIKKREQERNINRL